MQTAAQHDCGFELLQVCTGPAKKTAYLTAERLRYKPWMRQFAKKSHRAAAVI
jgi:hypothetical protein